MGYRCDVRIGTTKKGWEFIEKMAPKYYDNYIKSSVIEREEGDCVVIKEHGIGTLYNKKLDWKPEILRTTKDGKYVEFGWDDIKWMGYDFFAIKAYREAMEKSGEHCKEVCVGEDGATMEEEYNWKEDYDFPVLETYSCINDDEWA